MGAIWEKTLLIKNYFLTAKYAKVLAKERKDF